MMKKLIIVSVLLFLAIPSFSAKGLITIRSRKNMSDTIVAIQEAIKAKEMVIVAVINHSKAAKKAEIKLRDTVLIIFGNPVAGSKLMLKKQTAAIDLPQKMLVWKDKGGRVRISYNDPYYIADRHGISRKHAINKKISHVLKFIARTAAKR